MDAPERSSVVAYVVETERKKGRLEPIEDPIVAVARESGVSEEAWWTEVMDALARQVVEEYFE